MLITALVSGCHSGASPTAADRAARVPAGTGTATVGAATATAVPVRVAKTHHGLGNRVHSFKGGIADRALDAPDAIAAAGTSVWVANSRYEDGGGGWLTQIDATTGALIRVITAPRYRLTDPRALAVDGNTLWVADGNGDALTEINATPGALIRVIMGPRYQLWDPAAIAAAGGSVWVADGASNSLTQVSAKTGAPIRVVAAARYRLSTTVYPPAIAVAGNRVWVPDGVGNAVTEIDATTGALIRVITGPRYQLNGPEAIAVAGGRVWVVNVNTLSITEIDAVTGALIRVIPSLPNVPFAITADRAGVWLVTNLGEKAVDGTRPDGSVAELSATSGKLIRDVSGAPFRADSPGGAITSDGARVWVTDTSFYSYQGWVAELSAATGALIRVIAG